MSEENSLLQENQVSRRVELNELIKQRRSEFPHIDPTTGKIKSYWTALLIASANVSGIPILFSLGLYGYNLYLFKNVTPQDLLPVIFVGIAAFIFIDPMLGFIFDRIQKKQISFIHAILFVFAAIGLISSQAYLLSQDTLKTRPAAYFNIALAVALLSYSILNASSTKKIFFVTPSQKSRRGLIYLEGIMQALALFLIAGLPVLIKNSLQECNCIDDCANVILDECKTCLQSCQSFENSSIIQKVSLGCTCIFIAVNLLALWLISARNDERKSPSLYSFNKRLFDFLKNPFLTSATFIFLLEVLIIFTLVIWAGFYGYRQFDAPAVCIAGGSIGLLCTANDYFVLLVILILAFSLIAAITTLLDRNDILWYISTIFSFAVGICIYSAGAESKGIFIVVLVAIGFSFSVLPTTKAYFSDAFYYDEYRTGYVFPYYLTFIFNLAIKIAFLLAVGAIISSTDAQIHTFGVQETNTVNNATGTLMLIATIILAMMKYRLSLFHLRVFDKIQVAIQKNQSEDVEVVTFTDPITNQPICRPFIPKLSEDMTHLVYLDTFARESEFEKAYNQRFSALKKEATITFWISFFSVAISLTLLIVFAHSLASKLGWVLLIPLLVITFGLYIMIYSSNVRITASILLEELKLDKDYLTKYIFYRKQNDEVLYE